MAAPPSKQSPSNQKMHDSGTSNQNQLKDPPPSSLPLPVAAAASASLQVPTPTYKTSESSESYVVAKQLLNADNFEDALAVIEEELVKTTTAIRMSLGLSLDATADADLETEIELHEALAPLHYLYGTTLLYSIEESKDDGNDTGAMMTEAAAKASTTASTAVATPEGASIDSNNPWAHLTGPSDSAPAAPEANNNDDANAEDIQIAWENLEAARTIVEKMLSLATTKASTLSESDVTKLQLDLAQIHLREGDLQRINGNYTSAVGDYSSCLEILIRHNRTKDENNVTRDLDRKIADTQFNLGLTYLTSSSDLQKEVAGADGNVTNDDSGNASSTNPDQKEKATLLAREHCRKGIEQHVDCARTFCGILAKLYGVDPERILLTTTDADKTADNSTKKAVAGFKTTGLDDEDAKGDSTSTVSADASQTLNVWRKSVSNIVATSTPADAEDALRASDIVQVLDEIQETIDEAERSQEGVLQAAKIRVKAQQAAAALGGEEGDSTAEVTNADGSTTTIGFGKAASSIAEAAKTIETNKVTVADAKPMMVVKKKKKRNVTEAEAESTNNVEGDEIANKRLKTAE